MINIIDTSAEIYSAYNSGEFVLENWMNYIDRTVPQARDLCLKDMRECVSTEYSWEKCFLPVLNGVILKKDEVEKTSRLFHQIADHLDEKIRSVFGRSFDIDIILYLGLCNGAGWVTAIQGKTSILLGIEKILELHWNNTDDMNGLILHELGHVYQDKFGVLYRDFKDSSDSFLWQLFTEGIAMVFEQEIVNDSGYYHQDKNGWKNWCSQNIAAIASDFEADYHTMTRTTQRYFGDWAVYKNHTDVGYYLGTRLVRYILEREPFDKIICFEIEDVRKYFYGFIQSV